MRSNYIRQNTSSHIVRMNGSTRNRINEVKKLVEQHYEPGRQDRCKRWVYKHIVKPATNISERTFYRYLNSDQQ